jgi:hypothetical protein
VSEEEHAEELLEELIWTGSDVAGAAAGATIGLVIGGPPGAIAGSASGPAIARVFRYVGAEFKNRVLGKREEVRIGAVIAFAGKKIQDNLEEGKQVRQDGFFTEQPDDRSDAEEIFEEVLLAAQREHQEKKLRYYGNLVANIAFDPTISRERANLLLKIGEDLTYRQMCLLATFALQDKVGIALRQGDYRGSGRIEPEIGAVLQETYDLYTRNLVTAGGDALLGLTDVNPANMEVQGSGAYLYNLMELRSVDLGDLNHTASLLM